MEEERRQLLAHMPFDVIGEHAQEDVGAHSVLVPVTDRTDIEIDGLHAAEGAFDAGQILVGLNGFFGIEMLGRYAGSDDIDAVEARLVLNLLFPPLEGEMAVADIDREV